MKAREKVLKAKEYARKQREIIKASAEAKRAAQAQAEMELSGHVHFNSSVKVINHSRQGDQQQIIHETSEEHNESQQQLPVIPVNEQPEQNPKILLID